MSALAGDEAVQGAAGSAAEAERADAGAVAGGLDESEAEEVEEHLRGLGYLE